MASESEPRGSNPGASASEDKSKQGPSHSEQSGTNSSAAAVKRSNPMNPGVAGNSVSGSQEPIASGTIQQGGATGAPEPPSTHAGNTGFGSGQISPHSGAGETATAGTAGKGTGGHTDKNT